MSSPRVESQNAPGIFSRVANSRVARIGGVLAVTAWLAACGVPPLGQPVPVAPQETPTEDCDTPSLAVGPDGVSIVAQVKDHDGNVPIDTVSVAGTSSRTFPGDTVTISPDYQSDPNAEVVGTDYISKDLSEQACDIPVDVVQERLAAQQAQAEARATLLKIQL